MKRLISVLIGLAAISDSSAATYCNGIIDAVYKWDTMTSLSIRISMSDGTLTNWINMPTKSDESMALVALTTGKPVVLYWVASDVTVCANGWQHNRALQGYMVVSR